MKTLIIGSFALTCLALSGAGQTPLVDGGCEVVGVPTDYEPPYTGIDGPLLIAHTFNANLTQAQRNVILQATGDWRALIESAGHLANPYPITFLNGPLGGNTLARANVTWNSSTGTLSGATITIDNDGSSAFFIDPTPGGSGEFDGNGMCTAASCMNLTDLLTVLRHEVGHALGWTGAYGSTNPLTTTYISGLTFDPSRLDIAMDPAQTSHCNGSIHVNDLMTPTIPQELRRPIQMYPAAALPGRNIDHDMTLKFIDSNQVLFPTGTADLPWQSVTSAVTFEPAGAPFLIVPGTYDEVSLLTITNDHEFYVARGGSVLVK